MRREDAKHPVADQKVPIDRAARLIPPNGEVDRTSGENGEAGEDRIAEPPAMITDAGAEDHAAAGRFAQIGPLIGMPFDAAAGIHLLQAGDVGVDLL